MQEEFLKNNNGFLANDEIPVSDKERVDDLQCKGYRIIQNSEMFCFGMDAVLLANFVKFKPGGRYIDLGTGTGIIPILMAAKEYGDESLTISERYEKLKLSEDVSSQRFVGVELQKECAAMASRSVDINYMSDLVRIDQGDIKEIPSNYPMGTFNVVTSNPPYIKGNHGLENPDAPKNIARHEVYVTLEQVVSSAAYLLKTGGSFYMIHKPFRLAEIFATLQKYKLEPKRMQLVHPFVDKEPNMVMVEAVKGGGSMIKIERPLIVYESPGVYTKQLLEAYS